MADDRPGAHEWVLAALSATYPVTERVVAGSVPPEVRPEVPATLAALVDVGRVQAHGPKLRRTYRLTRRHPCLSHSPP